MFNSPDDRVRRDEQQRPMSAERVLLYIAALFSYGPALVALYAVIFLLDWVS